VSSSEFPEAEAGDGSVVPLRRLERRVALVTGGGSGAGAAIARRCALLGANVVVADIDYALAGEVAGSLRAAGTAALAHRCDVAAEDQVIALIDRAAREFGGLDLVFNVAGPWLDGDPLGYWSRIVGTNLLGTMHVTRHAIELLKRRGGSIVNVAADSGIGFGPEERPAYCAAKAGVVRLTAALRSLQEHKIRVNCIAPDVISSPDEFAIAAVNLALREDCAGRVALYSTGKAVQLVDYGDPGYRQVHAAPW
jgi:NAD(P)-dependent dehydrogenase (short-subunit alcohol dehydrogenase family)